MEFLLDPSYTQLYADAIHFIELFLLCYCNQSQEEFQP